MKLNKELLMYLISGGITTGVNYLLYAGLLYLHLPWLVSNTIAWTGAVLTAYALNRRWVFRSKNRILAEFTSFAGVRFLTLLAENALLWLLIDILNTGAFPSKLFVSVITVLGNYILCKYGIFKKEVTYHE